jgi:hypothetical protein
MLPRTPRRSYLDWVADKKAGQTSGDCYAVGDILDTAHDVGQLNGTALFGLHGAEPAIFNDYVEVTNGADIAAMPGFHESDWEDEGSKAHYVDLICRWNRHIDRSKFEGERMPWPDIITSDGVSVRTPRFTRALRGGFATPTNLPRGRYEYYEIKPDSPTGQTAGIIKLNRLAELYGPRKYRVRHKPGDFYPEGGTTQIPLPINSALAYLVCVLILRLRLTAVRIFLTVRRPFPGLLLYRVCVEIDTDDKRKQQTLAKALAKHIMAAYVITSIADEKIVQPLLKELGDYRFDGDALPRIRCAFDVVDELRPWTGDLADAMYMRGLAYPGEEWMLCSDEAFYQALVTPPYLGPTVDSLWGALRRQAETWAEFLAGKQGKAALQNEVIFKAEEMRRLAESANPGLKDVADAVLRWMGENKAATIALILLPLVVTAGVAALIEAGVLAGAVLAGELTAVEGTSMAIAGNIGRIAMTESVAGAAISTDVAAVSAFRGFQTVAQVAGQIGGLGTAANTNAIASALPHVGTAARGIAAAAAGITLMTMSTQARAATSGAAQGVTSTPSAGTVIAQHTSGLYLVRPLGTPRGDDLNRRPAKGRLINLREHSEVPAPAGRPEPPARLQARYLGRVVIS